MKILITRPLEDARGIAGTLAAMGHDPLIAPLLETVYGDGPPLDLAGVAGILATSANGVRALVRRTARRDIPVFAVGPQTTAEAQAPVSQMSATPMDARALAAAIPGWIAPSAGTLLHVCGRDNAGNLAERLAQQGYRLRREVLYAVQPLALPPQAQSDLRAGRVGAALFFSPRSAAIFVDAVRGLDVSGVIGLCISAATATALAPLAMAQMRVAARPNQDALLALLDSAAG